MARAAFLHGGVVLDALVRCKYGGDRLIATPLGTALAVSPAVSALRGRVDVIVPVPLAAARHRQRGFNQSTLLAAALGRSWGRPVVCHALRRRRETTQQTGLTRAARARNLRGAFEPRRPRHVRGRRVLLVDDVMTTGATVTACTRVLLRSGAKEVNVATLARA